MKALAIIPARGGSKRLPRKNLRPLGGRPLVAHTLAVGRRPFERRRIVVASDPSEAAAALRSGDARRVATGLARGDVRPLAFLFPAHRNAGFVVLLSLQLSEFPGAICIATLPDREDRVFLTKRHLLKQRCDRRQRRGLPDCGPRPAIVAQFAEHPVQRRNVIHGRPTATADQTDTVLGHKSPEPTREFVG